MKLAPLIVFLFTLTACGGGGGPSKPHKPPIVPPVVVTPPVIPIIGHIPMPGQMLRDGRTVVYSNNQPIAYIVRDPELFMIAADRAPADTGIWWAFEADGVSRRGVGDLPWLVSQFPGAFLTVVEP